MGVEVKWAWLVAPEKAAICFDSVRIYYEPKKGAKTGPDIVKTPDNVKKNFKEITVMIRTKRDLDPIDLPVCGDDRNKVIVFELKISGQKQMQWVKLKEIPSVCPKSNSGCKCEPFVMAILCSLILFFKINFLT